MPCGTRAAGSDRDHSLVISGFLSWFFMRRFGRRASRSARRSRHAQYRPDLYDLDRRIGTILPRSDWQIVGRVGCAGALIAVCSHRRGPAGRRVASDPRGIAVPGIFGWLTGAQFGVPHPDAKRAMAIL